LHRDGHRGPLPRLSVYAHRWGNTIGGPRILPMSDQPLRDHLRTQLEELRAQGLFKKERQLQGPQGSAIRVAGREVINFCANNYLGLANDPNIVAAARAGLERFGYGMASV